MELVFYILVQLSDTLSQTQEVVGGRRTEEIRKKKEGGMEVGKTHLGRRRGRGQWGRGEQE